MRSRARTSSSLYFADPVDVFFMHIQGSGRVKLTDGTTVRVHYDGKNGHPYTSIGRYLIEKGLFAADKVSMGALDQVAEGRPRARQEGDVAERLVHLLPRARRPEAGAPIGVP